MNKTAENVHRKRALFISLAIFSALTIIMAVPPPVRAQQATIPPQPVVAIHVSELTQALETMPATGATPSGSGTTGYQWWIPEWHYFVGPESLEESLRSDGTPYVEVSDANIAAGALLNSDGSPKYPILISLGAEAINNNEINPLLAYVNAGGFLFIGSSAFTRNPDGTTRGDFALASAMGLHMVNPTLQNWYESLTFTTAVQNRLVADIPAGTISWRLPLSSEEVPLGISPSHAVHGYHEVFEVSADGSATVLANGDSGPVLATKQYGNGNFIYHADMEPLMGHTVYDPSMYAYMIYRRAIEWAFQTYNLPIIKLSPWRYEYDGAFIVRHDFEDYQADILNIASSAAYENSLGVQGDYYFCTGTLRQEMTGSNQSIGIAGLQSAVAKYGATIGSHNGGLKNPDNSGLAISDFDYWHWGPDEALDVTPSGYASGAAYAQASMLKSFQDIQGWLAGYDNGRVGCGSSGTCPRIWVAPYMNATREASYGIVQALGAITAGEQKVGPFPAWNLSTQTAGMRYNTISIPASDWYVGSEVPGAIEWGQTTETMQAAVDFYYGIGASINLYGHIPSCSSSSPCPAIDPDQTSDDTELIGEYINYCLTKPRMWAANAVRMSDWWRTRSNVVVTPAYSITGNTVTTQATITGATDPDTTVEVDVPSGTTFSNIQVFLNGAPAGSTNYRTVGNAIKVRVGASTSSASVQYTMSTGNNPVPATTGLSPASTTAGGAGFTLTVNGSGFIGDSVVQWNGGSRVTSFVTSTQLTASISATDIATAGTATVTVFNPAPGGGTSNAQTFAIKAGNNPVPTTTSLSPASTTAGGAGFTLTVNGTNFVSGSVVQWNGANRTTTYVSSTQLTAAIAATDIATAGTATVTVFNPAPGGGTSNAQTFAINGVNNPVPTTTGLSPASTTAGGAGFALTVNGSGFVNGSFVQWNGANRTTTYVSPTQLTAAITAADIAMTGTASVTVFNLPPAGGTSNAQTFTINSSPSGSWTQNNWVGGGGQSIWSNATSYSSSSGINNSIAGQISLATTTSTLFSDNFTRPTGTTNPLLPWVASMGTWTVTGGVMKGTGSANQYSYAYISTSPSWTDYAVQGSIQMPAGSFGGGIGGRLNPSTGAHYGAWVYPTGSAGGSNVLKLWKFQGWTNIGAGTPMQQVSLPAAVGTGSHTLQMTFVGSLIQVYYDGVLEISYTDNNFGSQAAYLSGGISADWWTWSGPYTITVDNISVVSK